MLSGKRELQQMGSPESSENVVIVHGFAGLGNRLRTIASAIAYCKKHGRTLCINWREGMFDAPGTNSFGRYFVLRDFPSRDFEELKDPVFFPRDFDRKWLYTDIRTGYKRIENRYIVFRKGINLILHILVKLRLDTLSKAFAERFKCFRPIEIDGQPLIFGGDLPSRIEENAVIYLDNVPTFSRKLLKKHIALNDSISAEIDAYVREHSLAENSVGVHIRATDKRLKASVDRLIVKLTDFVEKKHIEKILVCADNSEMIDKFRAAFPDKVVVYQKYIPKGNEGMHNWAMRLADTETKIQMYHDAVMEMFLLSRTEYLLTNMESTFSLISAIYHENPRKCRSWQVFEFLGFWPGWV